MKKITKDYQLWMGVKRNINNNGVLRLVQEGDVWWAAVGENVGVEIDGKSKFFSRPVLVFKKYNRFCFTAIPLTTKKHVGTWYASFEFQ